ncbi:MAG: TfoX/Sxy family protein [Dehalococcoidia bacterium]
MPYNEKLAERVRALLLEEPDLVEQRMFGGLSFMLAGNLCVGVLGEDLVVRVPADEAEATSARPHVRPMDFTGRPMKNWFYVSAEGTKTKRALASWVERGRAFARTFPPK